MKIRNLPLLVVGSLVVSSSYCFSEVIYGNTDNAAANGFEWYMPDVLPSISGLAINGMIYRYTTTKDPNSDMTVTIRNENALVQDEYIFTNTDDWSQLPGSTIYKRITIPETSATLYGKGEMVTTGEGIVSDPTVVYEYRYDECYNPLFDPSCPGYYDALYAFLKERGLLDHEPDVNDPYYDQWVQWTLNQESEEDDDEELLDKEETEEDDEEIEKLNGEASITELVGTNQEQIMIQLTNAPQFNSYYVANIPGGVYEESITLQDTTLPDNKRAMKSLASDATHRSMVRSQYGE